MTRASYIVIFSLLGVMAVITGTVVGFALMQASQGCGR